DFGNRGVGAAGECECLRERRDLVARCGSSMRRSWLYDRVGRARSAVREYVCATEQVLSAGRVLDDTAECSGRLHAEVTDRTSRWRGSPTRPALVWRDLVEDRPARNHDACGNAVDGCGNRCNVLALDEEGEAGLVAADFAILVSQAQRDAGNARMILNQRAALCRENACDLFARRVLQQIDLERRPLRDVAEDLPAQGPMRG